MNLRLVFFIKSLTNPLPIVLASEHNLSTAFKNSSFVSLSVLKMIIDVCLAFILICFVIKLYSNNIIHL